MLPLKLGLIQTLTSLCWFRPDFARNAEWLSESTEVESAYSSANDPPSAERRILLSFLLFYGLVVEQFALKCATEIQKIQLVVQDLLHGARIFFSRVSIYFRIMLLHIS